MVNGQLYVHRQRAWVLDVLKPWLRGGKRRN